MEEEEDGEGEGERLSGKKRHLLGSRGRAGKRDQKGR